MWRESTSAVHRPHWRAIRGVLYASCPKEAAPKPALCLMRPRFLVDVGRGTWADLATINMERRRTGDRPCVDGAGVPRLLA